MRGVRALPAQQGGFGGVDGARSGKPALHRATDGRTAHGRIDAAMHDTDPGQKTPAKPPHRRHRFHIWERARGLGRHSWTEVVLALVLGGLGGYVASHLRIPLAWILGPLFACFAGTLMGLRLRPIPYGRQVAHAVVGLAIGLRLTPAVLAAAAGLIPAMGIATLYTIAVTTGAAFLLRSLAQVDRRTAFFGSAAAGMSEMAILAGERGGDPQAVSIVHAIRITCVVVVVPLLVFALGVDEGFQDPPVSAASGYGELALLVAVGLLAAYVARPFRVPSPWFLVPTLVGAITAAAWAVIEIPWALLVV